MSQPPDYPSYPDPQGRNPYDPPQGGNPYGPPQGGNPDDPNNPYRYGMPAAPPAYPQQPMQQGPRPPQVSNAVKLMYARSLIGVLSLIVLFATEDDLKKRIRENSPDLDSSAVNSALTIGAVFGVILLVLYVLLAMQVAKGRNWARIVTWVIGGLAMLGFLGGLAQPESPFYRVLAVVTVLIDVSIVVLLALKPSNDFFRRRY